LNDEIIVGLISNVTTILVGILTAVVAYKASVKGAKVQIEHERQLIEETLREQTEFATLAIERFISNEIKKNFKAIYSASFANSLVQLNEPFQSYLGKREEFSYEEFNKVKYELIKSKSTSIDNLIKIYDMFLLIDRKNDISQYTQNEYNLLKETYIMCLNEYWEK
jgi:hypothetical protein